MNNFFHKFSAERTNINNKVMLPTFFQHKKMYDFCRKYIKDKKVLEIGFGSGRGAYSLSQYALSFDAIDNDFLSVNEAKKNYKRKKLSYYYADILRNQMNKKYDVILLLQVFEHLSNPENYLATIRGMLKPNGVLILSTPNGPRTSYNENPYHIKEYSSTEMRSILARYFSVVKIVGLCGDREINKYENERKKKITKILSLDPIKLRNLIPLILRQRIFDIATFLTRYTMKEDSGYKYSEKNFFFSKNITRSLDIVAICKR